VSRLIRDVISGTRWELGGSPGSIAIAIVNFTPPLFAYLKSQLAAARDFLAALRSMNVKPTTEIDGHSVEEWIAWAVEWLQRANPTGGGVGSFFEQVAEITDWAYRD